MLDIVLATDDRGVLPTATATRSILDSTATPGQLRIHIVHSGLKARHISRLRRTAERTPTAATLQFHEFDLSRVARLLRSKNISRMAYARLFIADFLPAHSQRAVYLDFDTITRRDIVELLDFPLNGNILAAVPNGDVTECSAQAQRLGLASGRYLNSGVMLLDLPAWRSAGLGEAALRFAKTFPGPLIMHDQDALNAALSDRWQQMPSDWNTWAIHADDTANKIIHFTMAPKPWHADYTGPHQDLFFEAVDQTDFRGWRPPKVFGAGSTLAAFRRRIPYLPTAYRTIRGWLTSRSRT